MPFAVSNESSRLYVLTGALRAFQPRMLTAMYFAQGVTLGRNKTTAVRLKVE